jgi:hypothetical protein
MSDDEFAKRLKQAAKLQELGLDCEMCGGTGGWPGIGGWVECLPCQGMESSTPSSLSKH